MTWLTLRLQRTELILLLVAVVALVSILFASTDDAARQFRSYTNEECPVPLTPNTQGGYCFVEPSALYQFVDSFFPSLIFLPMGVAFLLTLPLMMELHDRSYRLAWTQGVTRGAWARTRLTVILLISLVVIAASIVLVRWWLPSDYGWNTYRHFDLSGIVAVGWLVFAIGISLAIGTLIRRPLVSIAIATAVFVLVRLTIFAEARPYLIPPREMTTNDPSQLGVDVWVVDDWYQRSDGAKFTQQQVFDLCEEQGRTQVVGWLESCASANGVTRHFQYQPESRYWPLQFVETGIFLALGVALIGFAAWYWLRRLE